MATTTTTAATSPPTSNILAPIPLNLVPSHTTSSSLSTASIENNPFKKRKVSHSETVNVHNDVFAVSASPQTISIRSHSASLAEDQDPYHHLTPITTLSRNAIPYSWIDFEPREPKSQSQNLPGWCNIFVGDIPVLENENAKDTVLAVRVVGEAGVWVVERVKKGVYALMRLRGVGEGEVVVAAKASAGSAFPFSFSSGTDRRRGRQEVGEWWEVAKIEDPEPVVLGKRGRGAADVEVVFAHVFESDARETQDEMLRSDEGSEGPVLLGVGEQSGDAAAAAAAEEQDVEVTQSPQELLDGLREQYLQALYVSKTSVAYFAKGPLARCRAAFQSSDNESGKPAQLVEFYREAILTAKRMDHKYRETLPTTVQDLLLSVSDDEAAPPKRKRRSTKKKLGKNGLYPEESDLIRKWWRDRALNDQGLPSEMSRDAESKKHIADLRLRETQLQILLILETMALEAIIADEKKREGNGEGADKPTKTAKGKKPQDLNVMLELHLDRLCIWHAVSFEETVVPDSAKTNHLSGKKVESDAVRDFCTEVIVPFYASRLPDKCKLITRKLGVSTAISPFTKQPQTKKTPREPGTPVERQHAQKSRRRAFQRVLTDQAPSQTRQPPSLSRSNTTPAPTESRRESLDPLLPTVSANVRGGIQKAKRVENREVDLNAVARQHETKLKKMQMLVDQKKELDAAIHALRKPNRELVAKDIAEDASKRLSTGGGSSRKPKNPVRNPYGQGVQVAATPKGSRKKDVMADMPPLPKSLSQPALIPQGSSSSPFTSEPQIVPGSNIRPSNSGLFRSADDGAIQETPTRRPTQPLSSADISASPKRKISGPLFRVPSKPAPAPTSVPAPVPPAFRATEKGPTTPIAARHVDAYMPRVKSIGSSKPSMIMETPPKPAMAPAFSIASAPAATEPAAVAGTPVKATTTITTTPAKANVFATPVKGASAARLAVPTAAPTVPVTPEKSIYAQLGWDDDDDFA
ncbi:hypothetical protein ASPFODRAFT_43784 [Aspergillus luchuensis CBS 106.47]|uniref:DNA replication regulator Sld3 C-terminal domain-containing protein n=1 Tax=Aspergillus luchuensis (strain CBS 106.47) TaxID=1137211 RepID=A0A1M3TMS4_ASPLC|nr:hypothetical protein ASPFODRAFT_43784 [Aspergillus luchuensis CBS 106.47]